MFKKFTRIEDRAERLEVFNLLKINLGACLWLAEFLGLTILVSGLGWLIGSSLTAALGRIPGAALAIGLMLLVIGLMRLPPLLLLDRLSADFGLDPRPASRRFRQLAALGLRRGAAAWLVSMALYLGLLYLDLWSWTLAAMLLGVPLLFLEAMYPRILSPDEPRPLRDDDLEHSLTVRLDHWADKTGLPCRAVMISTAFTPELEPPRLTGLGPTRRLVVPEKALAAFPPRELTVLMVAAVVGALVKAPLKLLLLRLCALAVAVPLASILVTTLGAHLWGYPLAGPPVLITLVWVAVWVGFGLAEFAVRLTRRSLDVQLAAAAVTLLQDEEALASALATLAEKNLEEDSPPAWREVFRRRFSRQVFIRRVKYHRHLSSFTEGQG